jgi:imidazole glycerol-phosphate synthase subunit HisF
MKKPIRIIPMLEIKNGLLIKGINFEGLRVLGNARDFAQLYYTHGADEICYQDSVATLYGTSNLIKFVSETAKNVFVPLTVGGGIRSINDASKMFKAGADKILINSAAIDNVMLLKKASKIFGSSNITIIIQAIKIDKKYYISKSNGRDLVNIDPVQWSQKVEEFGAGEIIITAINNEGLKKGFDIPLTKKIVEKVSIPVIAHGGAGNAKHIYDVIRYSNVSGVGVASILHYEAIKFLPKVKTKIGNTLYLNSVKKISKELNKIRQIKKFLKKNGIIVRDEK